MKLKFPYLALASAAIVGCAKLLPGSNPLVVRTEQLETQAYGTFDLFLKFDDQAMANPTLSNSWATSAHPFATYLRKPVVNGTNTVPFGIATILSLDQIKLSYESGVATSNSLLTAIDVLETTVAQADEYTNQFSLPK